MPIQDKLITDFYKVETTWYSVKVILPDDSTPKLVYSNKHHYNEVSTYDSKNGYWLDVYLEIVKGVTHWCEIQNPI